MKKWSKPVKNRWGKTLVMFVLLGSLTACNLAEPTTPVVEPTDTDLTERNEVETASTTFYGVGDTIVADTYQVEVHSFQVLEGDGQLFEPQQGKQFVQLELTVSNTGQNPLLVSSIVDFIAYADNVQVPVGISGYNGLEIVDALDGPVDVGAKMRGNIVYEVPTDWSELEVQVNIDVLSDDDYTILITND